MADTECTKDELTDGTVGSGTVVLLNIMLKGLRTLGEIEAVMLSLLRNFEVRTSVEDSLVVILSAAVETELAGVDDPSSLPLFSSLLLGDDDLEAVLVWELFFPLIRIFGPAR